MPQTVTRITAHSTLYCFPLVALSVPGGAPPTANLGPLKGGPLSLWGVTCAHSLGASLAHFRFGRRTRKYLKVTFPSPAGNGKLHLRQRILPCCKSQTSIVTTLYSASQEGQVKGIGSDLLIVQREGLLKMRAALACLDTLRRPTTFAAPQSPTLRREQRVGLRPAGGHTW